MDRKSFSAVMRSPTGVQFSRYSIVGFSGAIIDLGLYRLLTRCFVFWRAHYIGANAISFTCAVINNFVWHKLWTFRPKPNSPATAGTPPDGPQRHDETRLSAPARVIRGRPARRLGGQFVVFVAVSVVGLTLNSLILHTVSQHPMARAHLGEDADMFAKLVAIPVVWIWNFGANKLWTFRKG
ncbi:MAG: GtrA family protein [Armatimonadetes bacterium]|nr:GtrA family protein [Armatimonadota bacterium]